MIEPTSLVDLKQRIIFACRAVMPAMLQRVMTQYCHTFIYALLPLKNTLRYISCRFQYLMESFLIVHKTVF